MTRSQQKQGATPSRAQLERVAKAAAQKAAAIHRRYYTRQLQVMHKGEINLLTRADLESEAAIIRTIKNAFPDHAIVAEESASEASRSLAGPVWVIDPLDGTTNFAHKHPFFATSIAFRNNNQTQLGLVYVPLLDELFVAHKGHGAKLNGKRMGVSKIKTLNKALLATGFPYDRRHIKDNNLRFFCEFEMICQDIRRGGAASMDLAFVACGRLDGYWEPKLSAWDIAAGALLVEEAGGKVSTYEGKKLSNLWCGEILATNRLIHSKMLRITATKTSRPTEQS